MSAWWRRWAATRPARPPPTTRTGGFIRAIQIAGGKRGMFAPPAAAPQAARAA
jgi:hypothetical protein